MKMTIKTVLRCLSGFLLLAGWASCTSEVLAPEYGPTDEGSRSPMRIELGVSASDIGIRTRAAAGDDELSEAFASSKVKSLWVGVFDVQTGNLVGQTADFNTETETATVDILYYDAHPTLRVYGVANYDGVWARKGDDAFSQLNSLLMKVRTLTDFYTISVDAVSANAAAFQSGAPLMMGVFKSTGDNNGEKDFHTVEADGDTFSVTYGAAGTSVTLNDASVGSMYDRIDYKKFDGTIRLRRLLSQVNVTVAGNDEKGITVSNLRYRKVNMPNEVYLQERQTYTSAEGMKSYNTWVSKSPNKADSLIADGGPGNVGSTPGYDSDTEFTAVEGLSFTFHQYENKHWGVGTVSDLNDREAIRAMTDFSGGPVFAALCTDKEDATIYNNYASYFEISLDVRNENGKNGTVVYRIHEGRCNDVNGQEQNPNDMDFTCIRNTKYNYQVTVSGFNHLDVSVSHDHAKGNSGVAKSELWTVEEAGTIKGSDDASKAITFDGEILGYVFYSANGNDPKVFGADENSVLRSLPALSGVAWDEDLSGTSPLTIGGRSLVELTQASGTVALAEGVTFPEGKYNPKDYRYELYILTAAETMEDGCGAYTYWHVTYLPEDTRDPMAVSVDFYLAFANDWDAVPSPENGAVVGHIKRISIPEINWTNPVVDLGDLVYTIILDGEEVGKDADFANINLYTGAGTSFTANSVHKVQLVVSDQNDNFSDLKSEEKTFVVYPTAITWDNFTATAPADGGFYGKYDEYQDSDTGGFFKLKTNVSSWYNGYVQTGGTDKHCFDITPLYDGVVSIKASATGGSLITIKDSEVTKNTGERDPNANEDWDNYLGRYLLVSDGTSKQMSFASFSNQDPVKTFMFHVKKGERPIEIWTSRSLNIYSVSYAYDNQPHTNHDHVWNFSESDWVSIGTAINGTTNPAILEYDGLRFEAKGAAFSFAKCSDSYKGSYPYYFQNNKLNQVFSFIVDKPGKVYVVASSTNGNVQEDRYIVVQVGEESEPKKLYSGGIVKNEQRALEQSVTVDTPTRVYIYTEGGGLNIYSIEYKEN